MAPKRKLVSASGRVAKRPHNVLSLAEKVKILDKLGSGESASSVGRHYGINESTVRYIRKAEARIRESVRSSAPECAKVVSHARNPHIERMEKALNVWIEDNTAKSLPLSGPIIRQKALRLYR